MKFKSYKTEIFPNFAQERLMCLHVNVVRFVYNWGLGKIKDCWNSSGIDSGKKIPSGRVLAKMWTKEKHNFPWTAGVSRMAIDESFDDLQLAMNGFWRNIKIHSKKEKGFPRFKSRKNVKSTFRFNGVNKQKKRSSRGFSHISLPIIGNVKLAQQNYLPLDRKLISISVSLEAGRWFVSVSVEEDQKLIASKNEVAAIDLNIKEIVVSDGSRFENPRPFKNNEEKLSFAHQMLSKKKCGSHNYEKQKLKLQKIHKRISNIRNDFLHKTTSQIVNENQVIVVEKLNIEGMMGNRNLSKTIQDIGFGEFLRQIQYKADWRGRGVIVADRWFPSSKICCNCGWKDEKLTLRDRIFRCQCCKLEIDRDLNASYNLAKIYLEKQYPEEDALEILVSSTGGFSGIKAFGDGNSSSSMVNLDSLSLNKELGMPK